MYLWHCDQAGLYSLYSDGVTNENYLRGVQEADADGRVTFKTIFPAAYSGRWPHMHFEVYASLGDATGGGSPITTSQLALPEDVCNAVFATAGYEQSVQNLAADLTREATWSSATTALRTRYQPLRAASPMATRSSSSYPRDSYCLTEYRANTVSTTAATSSSVTRWRRTSLVYTRGPANNVTSRSTSTSDGRSPRATARSMMVVANRRRWSVCARTSLPSSGSRWAASISDSIMSPRRPSYDAFVVPLKHEIRSSRRDPVSVTIGSEMQA